MKPVVPPQTVLLISGIPRCGLGRSLGVSDRTLSRFLLKPWAGWPVGLAEAFCDKAGLDFWNLSLSNPKLREAMRRLEWSDIDQKLIRGSLDAMLRASGADPNEEKRKRLAVAILKVLRPEGA